jgi:hypothetical protein
VKGKVTGDPNKAVQAWNVELILEDVWINGRPITLDDCQWRWIDSKGQPRGIMPVIRHTPGWHPSKIEVPRATWAYPPLPGPITPPPPDPDPEPEPDPDPDPVDPCAGLRAELDAANQRVLVETLRSGALQSQIDTQKVQINALTAELDAAQRYAEDLFMQGVALQDKIDAAREALA